MFRPGGCTLDPLPFIPPLFPFIVSNFLLKSNCLSNLGDKTTRGGLDTGDSNTNPCPHKIGGG